jgi:hypothetical protein
VHSKIVLLTQPWPFILYCFKVSVYRNLFSLEYVSQNHRCFFMNSQNHKPLNRKQRCDGYLRKLFILMGIVLEFSFTLMVQILIILENKYLITGGLIMVWAWSAHLAGSFTSFQDYSLQRKLFTSETYPEYKFYRKIVNVFHFTPTYPFNQIIKPWFKKFPYL